LVQPSDGFDEDVNTPSESENEEGPVDLGDKLKAEIRLLLTSQQF
jgi:hypothetical protein